MSHCFYRLLAIWDRKPVAVKIFFHHCHLPTLILMPSVHLAFAAVPTRGVAVQVTVIVLQQSNARLLQMNAWYPLTGFMLFVLFLVKVMRVLVQECHLML